MKTPLDYNEPVHRYTYAFPRTKRWYILEMNTGHVHIFSTETARAQLVVELNLEGRGQQIAKQYDMLLPEADV